MTRIDGARASSPATRVEWQKALQQASVCQPREMDIAGRGTPALRYD